MLGIAFGQLGQDGDLRMFQLTVHASQKYPVRTESEETTSSPVEFGPQNPRKLVHYWAIKCIDTWRL